MKLYIRNRLRSHILKRWMIQLSSILALIIIVLIYFIISQNIFKVSYVLIFVLVAAISITATSFKRNFSIQFKKHDIEVLKIIIAYLVHKGLDIKNNRAFLREKFKPFKENQFYQYLDQYSSEEFNFEDSILSLAGNINDLQIYLLELMFDISLAEGVLKKDDEDFIDSTVLLMGTDINIYLNVKNNYIKKGLKTEREIYNYGNEQVVSGSFKLLSACQVLEVSPDVNGDDLKKAYRSMAKQYHPDKFHGLNNEKKKFAEEKFQEIRTAYEVITRHKGF